MRFACMGGEAAQPKGRQRPAVIRTRPCSALTANVEGLSGWRCEACGEVEFDPAGACRYAAAGDVLVMRGCKRQSKEIRRIRHKLGLSQVAAARLTGGGHNAFSRYERGETAPLPTVVNLFRLLDKHPELLADLAA